MSVTAAEAPCPGGLKLRAGSQRSSTEYSIRDASKPEALVSAEQAGIAVERVGRVG